MEESGTLPKEQSKPNLDDNPMYQSLLKAMNENNNQITAFINKGKQN